MFLSPSYPILSYRKALKEISRRNKYQNSEYKFPTETISTLDSKIICKLATYQTTIKPLSTSYYYVKESPFCSEREFLLYRKYLDRVFYYAYTYEETNILDQLPISSLTYCPITKTYFMPILLEAKSERVCIRLYFVTFVKNYHSRARVEELFICASNGKLQQPSNLFYLIAVDDKDNTFEIVDDDKKATGISNMIIDPLEGEFMEITTELMNELYQEEKLILPEETFRESLSKRIHSSSEIKVFYSLSTSNLLPATKIKITFDAICTNKTIPSENYLYFKEPLQKKVGTPYYPIKEQELKPSKIMETTLLESVKRKLECFLKKLFLQKIITRYYNHTYKILDSKNNKWYVDLILTATDPDSDLVQITPNTIIEVYYHEKKEEKSFVTKFYGYQKELDILEKSLVIPLTYPELFRHYQLKPPSGVLLHGPPGTGKTLLARELSRELGINYILKSAPEFSDKFVGEAEKAVRELFQTARDNVPCMIIIDEIDVIVCKRDTASEHDKRLVTQFLTELDGLEEREGVIVIGLTNRIDSIDSAIRRDGRFGLEIQVGLPSYLDRLEQLIERTKELPLSSVNLYDIADKTSGYSGADLGLLVREATLKSLRRVFEKNKNFFMSTKEKKINIPPSFFELLEVTMQDFKEALSQIRPTVLKEDTIENPTITFSDIIGLEQEKKEITTCMRMIKESRLQKISSFKPIKGILLEGPSGTGKTLLAKAIAKEFKYAFLNIDSSSIVSKYVGQSEKEIAALFKRARSAAPCIIFIDEIDSLLPSRGSSEDSGAIFSRIVNQFLIELDGLRETKGLLLVGATNRKDLLDPAVIRPGRIDKIIKIGLPKLKDIISIILKELKDIEIPKDLVELVTEIIPSILFSKRVSGAEVCYFVREILLNSYCELEEKILMTRESINTSLNNLLRRLSSTANESTLSEF